MTRISGVHIMAAPCCGARYSSPRYLSVNFSAQAFWTDGWRDASLMPNDEGLRRCQCGCFVLHRDLVMLETAESSELPRIDSVPDEQLLECIATADRDELERAARLVYWRSLNHPYRHRYRAHREAEEAATQAAWEAANPDRRTRWDKLLGREAPQYRRPADSPLTYPPFEATPIQQENMTRLAYLLMATGEAQGGHRTLELAELHRELGCFDEARAVLGMLPEDDASVTSRLIGQLIDERHTGPVRYRF